VGEKLEEGKENPSTKKIERIPCPTHKTNQASIEGENEKTRKD